VRPWRLFGFRLEPVDGAPCFLTGSLTLGGCGLPSTERLADCFGIGNGKIQGGTATGPNPTDRGKPGTKRHFITDRRGIPLAFVLTGANTHDSVPFAEVLDAVPPLRGKRGRPRRRPEKLHADKASDHARCRRDCRKRHIKPRIARRGIESKDRLGRHRWVVERTFAWINRFRRLTIRYERREDIHYALTSLACSLICLNRLRGRF
jgi:transposase